ncbi:MAG: CPBP family intramembrane metalloprotease [Spirochaetales bacterium]|nr:CPBP family intramembrane metalloprotease [Spirochaetales bacterium]MCF7937934.1 CPBP family intramembrane metalloprotease [Spirochaetales bacterium]
MDRSSTSGSFPNGNQPHKQSASKRDIRRITVTLFFVLLGLSAASVFFGTLRTEALSLFPGLSSLIGATLFRGAADLGIFAVLRNEAVYQISSLAAAGLLILTVFLVRGRKGMEYLRRGNINAVVKPERWMALKPKEGEGWRSIGFTFTMIITAVTAVALRFQLFSENCPSGNVLSILPAAVGFSAVNAFVEESVFRFFPIALLSRFMAEKKGEGLRPGTIAVISGVVFGIVHYIGTPGGAVGMLLAAFIGWFLAKAMIETRGFFWPWFIHFIQDVVIFSALFLSV